MVKIGFQPFRFKRLLIVFLVLLTGACFQVSGQETVYNYFYRIWFRDKGNYDLNDFSFSDLISSRAAERRLKTGIIAPEFNDLPVNKEYLGQIASLGLKLHCTSKWMNTALFKSIVPVEITSLANLPFVSKVKVVKSPGIKGTSEDKLAFNLSSEDLPYYRRPLTMLNGLSVQNSGFTGKGILIAVLDAGFYNADNITSLARLRDRNGIKGTYDFVKNNNLVYNYQNHGTAVLSVLSGQIPGQIAGTSPDADYWLLRTEDPESEYPVEEDFWIAGAEFADSIGADIISSSLGYFTFDDPGLNYKYSDMDGNSAFITRAADIAASKGILVVCSAGNERNNTWLHIIAPSDGNNVLAVGAVDASNLISSFSSAGPSYDRRIKPDVVAQGVSVPVQVQTSVINRSNGTSFSCPVISGMCACIMQAVPHATSTEIISAIHQVSDRYLSPDSLYGYGIPDMAKLIIRLQEAILLKPQAGSVVSPNPFLDEFRIIFKESPEWLDIEIFDFSGKLIARKIYGDYVSRSMTLNDLEGKEQGIYFIKISSVSGTLIHKVIKISR